MARIGFVYLCLSVVCLVLGAVYEHFSHGVYSGWMVYAFAFPLVGGALPFYAMAGFALRRAPGSVPRGLYHAGIATLTVGSFFQGALDIYGTTQALTVIYWIVGGMLAAMGVALYAVAPLFHSGRAKAASKDSLHKKNS